MLIRLGIVRDYVTDLVRTILVRATLIRGNLTEPEFIFHSWDCQIMSEHTCKSHVNQSQDCQRPCHRPCQCCTWRSCTCQSHTCQGIFKSQNSCIAVAIVRSCQHTLVRAMIIRARIVRDHVRNHVKRARHVRATYVRAWIVRDYVRLHWHSQHYQRLCQSHNCKTHINHTTIVINNIRAALVTVERWSIPGSWCSINLMTKV